MEDSLTQDQKEQIRKALVDKGVNRPCPRCNNKNFVIADGYVNQTIQPTSEGFTVGGRGIPSAVIICMNCGFVSYHALGPLGLLKKERNHDNND